MIDPVWMAIALLALSWVTALMVALDALIDVKAWLGRLRRWNVSEGTAFGTVGALEIEQRARTFESGAIGFFERSHRSQVLSAPVEVQGVRYELQPSVDAEVWVDRQALERAAACASPGQFAELAQRAKGTQAVRTVRVEIGAGQRVFVAGARTGLTLTASLVSTVDPRLEAHRRVALNLGLVALNLAWVSVGTVLALWPPAFGPMSIVGACVLIGHFLGITPLAVEVRERSKTPAARPLLGEWSTPQTNGLPN